MRDSGTAPGTDFEGRSVRRTVGRRTPVPGGTSAFPAGNPITVFELTDLSLNYIFPLPDVVPNVSQNTTPYDEPGTEDPDWAGFTRGAEDTTAEADGPAWTSTYDADEHGEPGDDREHRCQHCGGHVTPRFERVMGDTNDVVHRCPRCDQSTRLLNGSAAGRYPSGSDRFEARTD